MEIDVWFPTTRNFSAFLQVNHGAMSEEHQKSRLKQEIDSNLKRVYDTVLQEEIPDRFKDLLAQLRAKDSKAADRESK